MGKSSDVKTAANTVLKALGTAKIKVFVSGTTSALLEFTVMPDCPYPMIIGHESLRYLGGVWNLDERLAST